MSFGEQESSLHLLRTMIVQLALSKIRTYNHWYANAMGTSEPVFDVEFSAKGLNSYVKYSAIDFLSLHAVWIRHK